MTNQKKLSAIFAGRPIGWGLRGDPHLWDAFEASVSNSTYPESIDELNKLIESLFEQLTGFPISHQEDIYIKEFAHGGMSSGHVCPEYWRNEAFPLLRKRYKERYDK